MEPIHAFMPEALAALLRDAPLCPEKVTFAWRAAVGPAMNHVSRVELHDHVLRVQTKNAAWQREIERSAGLIRTRLSMLLGDDVVRELDVRVSRGPGVSDGPPAIHTPRRPAPRRK
jgi:hypothetical protein